jgi:hypothetical protein
MSREFFEQERCDRCQSELMVRTMSWFNRDVICTDCSDWEDKIIEARDESSVDLEDIGHVPEVSFEVNWGEEVDK